MDIEKDSKLNNIVSSLSTEREQIRGQAENLPGTAEDYMSLSIDARLKTAENILRIYANISHSKGRDVPSEESCATTTLTLENEGRALGLEARVGYDQGSWTNAVNSTRIDKHPSIRVWLRATDPIDEIQTKFVHMGDLEFGRHQTPSGEWSDEPQRVSGIFGDEKSALDETEAQNMVEIIDAAVSQLITDEVARAQQLG